MPFFNKISFFDKNFKKKNPIQNRIKKCSRMILVMTLQHACSGSLQHLKFLSLAAHHCHQWAWSQLILNQRIISASAVSIKKTNQVQRHLLKRNGFSKLGRKSWVTPLNYEVIVLLILRFSRALSKENSVGTFKKNTLGTLD